MPQLMQRRWLFSGLALCALCSIPVNPVSAISSGRTVAAGQAAGGTPVATMPAPQPVTPAGCNGSVVALIPANPPFDFTSTSTDQERGAFVTALRDFHICSIGIKISVNSVPQTLNVYIHAANGITRGALLATSSVSLSASGLALQFVPIDFTFHACQDYELTFMVPANDDWERWDTRNTTKIPYDDAGVMRVRYMSCGGCSVTFAIPHIEMVGTEVAPAQHTSDLAGLNATTPTTSVNEERGIYVNMRETSRLSSFGFEADLVPGQVLTATVYKATGTTRGDAIATGTYLVPSSGMQWHDIPVNALLVEGNHYDIAVQFAAANLWYWWDERTFAEPFTRDVYDLLDAEYFGNPGNFALPHFRTRWNEHVGGVVFDLRKPGGPLTHTNSLASGFGIYITSLANERLYGIGWQGDVPPGEYVTATLSYANGTTMSTQLVSGTITSSVGGMRWHDIPLSWELQPNTDYDINITWTGATQWRYWDDRIGLPYTSYGVIQVRDAEWMGDPSSFALIELRVHACNPTLTPVLDGPARVPMFLAAPAPNPAGYVMRVDFQLEESAFVSLRVYDVSGQLVNTVLQGSRPKGLNSALIDARHFSSGVYFLKLQSPTASVTRKFVVVR